MAFDGFTVACIREELQKKILDGRITKIIQPEKDELVLQIKTREGQHKLQMSANPSLPMVCLTDAQKRAPETAPAFCMFLRKYLGGGKIVRIEQPSLERVLMFVIESRSELGDLCETKLIVELMGRHSNIIVTDSGSVILDSIRKISHNISSVREVLPGRPYFIPGMNEKIDPLTVGQDELVDRIFSLNRPLAVSVYQSVTGFSPMMAEELCTRASLDSALPAREFGKAEREHFATVFFNLIEEEKNGDFHPVMYSVGGKPAEYSVIGCSLYTDAGTTAFSSISALLRAYYSEKELAARNRQKSADLRKIVGTALERNVRKLDLQEKQLKDTEKKDKYRIYGELINTYGYSLPDGSDSLTCVNYYDGREIRIPLDPDLTAAENARRYFDRYNKLKRTEEALTGQREETAGRIEHLKSIRVSLDTARDERDLADIDSELREYGYLRQRTQNTAKNTRRKGAQNTAKNTRRKRPRSEPLHYLSSDGFDMYVGKNNYQNEELTFGLASGSDWWFHAKKIPGSHVIVRAGGREITDRTFEEAASLAAHYSASGGADKVEVDYTMRRNLKKPNGANPGFVIYHTNYSMLAGTDISGIKTVENTGVL